LTSMELNHILLFAAVATSALILLQAFQPQTQSRRARAAVVLIASALAWLLARPIAGWLSALVWCALLVVPAFLRARAARGRRFVAATPSSSEVSAAPSPRSRLYRRRAPSITVSPVVLALIILNVAVFVLELLAGGSTNPAPLHRLGELGTNSVILRHS